MKFTQQIEINAPIEKVVKLFDSPDNLGKWMKGLKKFVHISGTPGKPGAKSRLVFDNGKHQFELIETITKNNLPHEMSGNYEHKYTVNTMSNRFKSVGNKTRYETEVHYTKLNGFMIKLMALLMPGMFKKQVLIAMNNFKTFVESSPD